MNDNEFLKEYNKGIESGRDTFEFLIKRTDGKGGSMILALSAMLASMEVQSPGVLESVMEGAELMVDKIAEENAGRPVKDLLDKIYNAKH